jgi:hypothetical protein
MRRFFVASWITTKIPSWEARFRASDISVLLMVLAECLPEDQVSSVCVVSIALDEGHDYATNPILGPGEYEVTWRRSATDVSHCDTYAHSSITGSLLRDSLGLHALVSLLCQPCSRLPMDSSHCST